MPTGSTTSKLCRQQVLNRLIYPLDFTSLPALNTILLQPQKKKQGFSIKS